MEKLLALIMVAGLISCSPVTTVFDYDKEVDFTAFKSFKFTEDDLEETVGQFNRERILSALEKELAAKGLIKAEDPDLLVNVLVTAKQVVEVNAASQQGYGSMGWRTANADAYLKFDEYTDGSMFITMADNDSKIIIWQGVGTRTIDESATGEEREANITEAIQEILKHYPPVK